MPIVIDKIYKEYKHFLDAKAHTQSVVNGAPLHMSSRTASVSPFLALCRSCLPSSTIVEASCDLE